jgi:hypothetical protein
MRGLDRLHALAPENPLTQGVQDFQRLKQTILAGSGQAPRPPHGSDPEVTEKLLACTAPDCIDAIQAMARHLLGDRELEPPLEPPHPAQHARRLVPNALTEKPVEWTRGPEMPEKPAPAEDASEPTLACIFADARETRGEPQPFEAPHDFIDRPLLAFRECSNDREFVRCVASTAAFTRESGTVREGWTGARAVGI